MKAFLFACAAVIVGFFIFVCLFQSHSREDFAVKILFFAPFYGAFFAITFLCLLCATPKRRANWERVTLWIIGLLFLLLQGACWGAATAFGNATGGPADATRWHNAMAIATAVFVVWTVVIVWIAGKE